MSFTKMFKETMQNVAAKQGSEYKELYKDRMISFRKSDSSIERLEKPTNIVRARSLGFKAKQGIFVVRVRVRRGSGLFRVVNKSRRPKRKGINKLTRRISIQRIAEQRAASKHRNAEVINSYWIGEDGKHKYFEIILADRGAPTLINDKFYAGIISQKGRAQRGITSAGRKNRGLDKKGIGTEKLRPGLRSRKRLGK